MSRNLALVLVGMSGICWASSGIAAQDFFSRSIKIPLELTNIRMCIAGFLMLIMLLVAKKFKWSAARLNRNPKLWLYLFLYGLIGIVMVQFSYFQAISKGGAAATTVILSATPAMVVIWESLYNKKFPARIEILAVILAIVGVFFLVTGGDPTKILVPLPCVFWSLTSGASFAFSMIFGKVLFAEKINPAFVTSVGMFGGGLVTFLLIDNFDWMPFFESDVILNVGWIIIFGTVIAFWIFNEGLKYLTPEESALVEMTEPVSSVVLSYFVFGTIFGRIELLGIILVLFAVISPVLKKKF